MISAISGKKTASKPHNSGLWPLLRATDIVKARKMTQKNTIISHQTNPMVFLLSFANCANLHEVRPSRFQHRWDVGAGADCAGGLDGPGLAASSFSAGAPTEPFTTEVVLSFGSFGE